MAPLTSGFVHGLGSCGGPLGLGCIGLGRDGLSGERHAMPVHEMVDEVDPLVAED